MATAMEPSLLSDKQIKSSDRLIYALDHPSHTEAWDMVETLGPAVSFYKLGLQMLMTGDYNTFVQRLVDMGKQVFIDVKFFDVPETVAAAVAGVKDRGATFVTVHGNEAMLKAAVAAKGDSVKILGVTVLTSLDQADMNDMGFKADIPTIVLSRAKRALAVGCDGVISSGLEAPLLRSTLGSRFLIVSPGIRPGDNTLIEHDDQKRVVTVQTAFRNGADYIVVGRPIRKAADPRAAAGGMQATIAEIFG